MATEFEESTRRIAVKLRMSPSLLLWFRKFGVRRAPDAIGRLSSITDPVACDEYSAWLWKPWAKRNVPKGIAVELRREARGVCQLCSVSCDVLEEAHIKRLGKELAHYCQHPHNLTLLCPTCHRRYDKAASALDIETVEHAKDRALDRLVSGFNVDLTIARHLRDLFAAGKTKGGGSVVAVLPSDESIRNDFASISVALEAEAVVSPGATAVRLDGLPPDSFPITAGVLKQVDAHPAEDIHIEIPEYEPGEGDCARCSSGAAVENYLCMKCGEDGHLDVDGEFRHEQRRDGKYTLYESDDFCDMVDSTAPVPCPNCGGKVWEIHYEAFCSSCRYTIDKVMAED